MNFIGQRIAVLTATDPTLLGISGTVTLESLHTLTIDTGAKSLMVQKAGSTFKLLDSGRVLTSTDIAGRLQDRLGRPRR